MLPTEAPPESGSIQLALTLPPVSLQAAGWKKAAIKTTIRDLVSPCGYLLAGDLQATIEWRISQRARYESDNPADVDNIVKPILDALSGPDGIMIDDCQIQALTCYWTGGYSHPAEESVVIDLAFDADSFYPKEGLIFLQVDKASYFPLDTGLSRTLVLRMAEQIATRFQQMREMEAQGVPSDAARMNLPIQRVFHRSKVGAYRIATLDELRRQLA